jgi:hypothetical protein
MEAEFREPMQREGGRRNHKTTTPLHESLRRRKLFGAEREGRDNEG